MSQKLNNNHDTSTGAAPEAPASERDQKITALIAEIRAAKTMARRDDLFDQIIGVWEGTAATTASESGEPCKDCGGTGTATMSTAFGTDSWVCSCSAPAPSRDAAPLDRAAEKEKFIAWGRVFHRNARNYTARDFDHGFAAWLAAKYDAAQAAHAGADTEKQAARYRWLRDKSEPGICAFYLSVGQAFKDVKFAKETVDDAIDAQIAAMSAATEAKEQK